GVTSWLDATPAGAAVYGPLGFTPTIKLRRLRVAHTPRPRGAPPSPRQIGEFLPCATNALGFYPRPLPSEVRGRGAPKADSRRDLLQELSGRAGSRLISNGDAIALIRDGRTARHIGPLFATSPVEALAIVRDIVAGERGPLLIDVVATQTAFLDGLAADGWTIERPFQRMRFGRATTHAEEMPFAVAGPEFG